jgi:hypothetical protein
VRVRILKGLTGIIEGQSLSQFTAGEIYEVDDFLGTQLVLLSAATEVPSTHGTATSVDADFERLAGGVHVVQRQTAEDRPERRRRKRTKEKP